MGPPRAPLSFFTPFISQVIAYLSVIYKALVQAPVSSSSTNSLSRFGGKLSFLFLVGKSQVGSNLATATSTLHVHFVTISVSRQQSTTSCSRTLQAMRSVRQRLLGENRMQRVNFALYDLSARKCPVVPSVSSGVQRCTATKVPCTPSSREVLIEAGLHFPKT